MTTLRATPEPHAAVARRAQLPDPYRQGAADRDAASLLPSTRSGRAVIVTNPVVAALHLDAAAEGRACAAGIAQRRHRRSGR